MAGTRASNYIVKWHVKGKSSKTSMEKGLNAMTTKKNFLKSIGGGHDVIIESITKA